MLASHISFNAASPLLHRPKRAGRQSIDRAVVAFKSEQAQRQEKSWRSDAAERNVKQVTRVPVKTIIEPFRIKVLAQTFTCSHAQTSTYSTAIR